MMKGPYLLSLKENCLTLQPPVSDVSVAAALLIDQADGNLSSSFHFSIRALEFQCASSEQHIFGFYILSGLTIL